MNERQRQYMRVIRQFLALGVTRAQVREAVIALRAGTDPDELASALSDYVPFGAQVSELPLNAFMANERPAGAATP